MLLACDDRRPTHSAASSATNSSIATGSSSRTGRSRSATTSTPTDSSCPMRASRATALEQIERWLAELRSIDPATLSPAVRADWAMLENELLGERWSLTELRAWQWNPSPVQRRGAVRAAARASTYAPLDERLRTFLARLANVPAYYAAAKAQHRRARRASTRSSRSSRTAAHSACSARSSSTRSTTSDLTARRARDVRAASRRGARGDRGLRRLARSARRAARERRRRCALVPPRPRALRTRSSRSRSNRATRPRRSTRARSPRRTCCSTRMALLADLLWPKYFPNDAPHRATRSRRSAASSRGSSDDHVPPAAARAARSSGRSPSSSAGCASTTCSSSTRRSRSIVRETPPHKRGIAGASIDAPGPYDAGAPTYYNVTPLDDLRAERAESWLREYNRWMLPVLNIHEAIPGHYVQLVYANRSPSLIKSIFGNGAMIEGWAVYAERMMLESGYGEHKRRGVARSTRSGTCAASATRSSTTACTCSA